MKYSNNLCQFGNHHDVGVAKIFVSFATTLFCNVHVFSLASSFLSLSLVDDGACGTIETNFLAFVVFLVPDFKSAFFFCIVQCDIGNVNGSFFFDCSTILHSRWLNLTSNLVYTFDDNSITILKNLENTSCLGLLISGTNNNGISFYLLIFSSYSSIILLLLKKQSS